MECKDINCPKHGTLSTRGIVLEGVVVSDKMHGTAIVQRDRMVKVKKYDRYKKSRSKIPVHNPPCINAKQGDVVKIIECRKLSKTVNFVIVDKLQSEETRGDEVKAKPKAKAKITKEGKKKVSKKKKEVENG